MASREGWDTRGTLDLYRAFDVLYVRLTLLPYVPQLVVAKPLYDVEQEHA